MAVRYSLPPERKRYTTHRRPPPPYGHALMGVRVLKFDGAIAPRVLKFDSGSAAEGCSMAPYIY